MTREELAERIDISPHYIYEIERGSKTMSLQTLELIALELNQSIDYLFWGNSLPFSQDEDSDANDELREILEQLPTAKRNAVSDILSAIIPYLK
ncbi:MAG: helix-turn-helix transcriptional regulator [Clostridiales bacterium]|nr:helix-turn-helix transcriptional regulator [Clostridiales bacterium]